MPLFFCPHHIQPNQSLPPFFRAFHGLAIDDCEAGCWVLALQFAHGGIECMMDFCKYTGAMQLDKVVMRRAFGWKVLG